MSFFQEPKRRNVVREGIAYALMAILEREGFHRPEPAVPPFRCPPASQ